MIVFMGARHVERPFIFENMRWYGARQEEIACMRARRIFLDSYMYFVYCIQRGGSISGARPTRL